MNEERFGFRIRQNLNRGLPDISPAAARRLEAARHLALARQKQTAPQMAAAGQHGIKLDIGHLGHLPHVRQGLAILALLIGMAIAFYWQSDEYVSELGDVDSALLSDDLPPEAFMDKDFFKWLKEDDSSAQ